MHMTPNIQIPPPARLMQLANLMPMHIVIQRIEVSKILRRASLPAMMQRMHAGIILLHQPFPKLGRQRVERRPSIGKLGVAACMRRRQYRRSQQAVRSSPRVERAVDVEEAVAFPVVRARAVRAEHFAVVVDVAGVEELVVFVARLAAAGHVGPDVVEVAETSREGHVRGVV